MEGDKGLGRIGCNGIYQGNWRGLEHTDYEYLMDGGYHVPSFFPQLGRQICTCLIWIYWMDAAHLYDSHVPADRGIGLISFAGRLWQMPITISSYPCMSINTYVVSGAGRELVVTWAVGSMMLKAPVFQYHAETGGSKKENPALRIGSFRSGNWEFKPRWLHWM